MIITSQTTMQIAGAFMVKKKVHDFWNLINCLDNINNSLEVINFEILCFISKVTINSK